MSGRDAGLLPGGHEVPFAQIEATLARLVRDGRRRKSSPARALTATVVVVGTTERLAPAADALEQLGEAGGVRAILISEGAHTAPTARVTENSIAIAGLAPRFLNNAVAALRLSSLPALVWWRGGSVAALDGLADLADRLVLDTEDPAEAWKCVPSLLDRTAVSDLRWTRLTRWRALLAHLFDLPQVRGADGRFARLEIDAGDMASARLFAGWLRSTLRWAADARIELHTVPHSSASPIESVRLSAEGLHVALGVRPNRTCLEAAVEGDTASLRVVPLGDGNLSALIGEELGVRTRDLAFEQALAHAQEIQE